MSGANDTMVIIARAVHFKTASRPCQLHFSAERLSCCCAQAAAAGAGAGAAASPRAPPAARAADPSRAPRPHPQ